MLKSAFFYQIMLKYININNGWADLATSDFFLEVFGKNYRILIH